MAPRQEEISQVIKGFVQLGVIIGVITAVFNWTWDALGSGLIFSHNMRPETSLEILRAIMQVDGVLIGFIGLMATFILADIRQTYHSLERWEQKREQTIQRLESRRFASRTLTGIAILLMIGSILFTLHSMSQFGSFSAGDVSVAEAFFAPLCLMFYGIGALFLLLTTSTELRME